MPAATPVPTLPLQALLDDAGLNRQHVFELAALPEALLAPLDVQPHERQLLLFAQGGRRLWDEVQAAGGQGPHPVDGHSMRSVERWLELALPGARSRFVYPRGLPAGRHLALQALGRQAGWHHASPFMVGVDAHWGSWYAYRAAVLCDTTLPATPVQDLGHPCERCADRPCVPACPPQALGRGAMDLQACQQQRLREGSPCALDCLARQACPVGAEHRYSSAQMQHASAASLKIIRRLATGTAPPPESY